ncbi:MAG: efflux RND transporter periplasmic adaptor subunit [Anaerolineales bacterium]|nr:efflux RND transporter periplasmic adaptor subunit [Anaerolineales bacterium]
MNTKRILVGLLLVVSAALLAAFQPFNGEAETAVFNAPAASVAAQTGVGQVTTEGQIVPRFFSDLSFQTGGVVADILVAEGDHVQTGDPLIQLDDGDLEIVLQQAQARLVSAEAGLVAAQNQLALAQAGITTAEANVTTAEANLALTVAGPLPAEIARAESNLASAQAGLVQAAGSRDAALSGITDSQIRAAEAGLASATAELRAIEDQYQAIIDACFDTPNGEVCPLYGPVEESTRAQLEVAQANQVAAQEALSSLQAGPTAAQQRAANGSVAVAQANIAVAQAQLDLLLEEATPEEVTIAEVAVQQAQVSVALAQVDIVQAEAAVTQAEAAVETVQASVTAAQAALDRMTLRATFDGTIARINVNEGELVGGSVPVVSMADFSAWLVKTTDLTELDVAQVQVGQSADVSVDAIPDEIVAGTVTNVALVSSLSSGDVVYAVEIELDSAPDLPLRWGMTVSVDINAN